MSEITSLMSQVEQLDGSVGRWNSIVVWLTAATAFVAVLYGISTFVLRNKSNALRVKQNELLQEKDHQLQIDLKSKDLEIQNAKTAASGADLRAGEANKAAGKANERAGRVEHEAAGLRAKAAELEQANLKTSVELERERITRLELEKSLAPRMLPILLNGKNGNSFDSLKPFAGIGAIIAVIPDAEARRAANEIWNTLRFSGWNAPAPEPEQDPLALYGPGVVVQYRMFSGVSKDDRATVERSRAAARSLLDFLHANGWEANPYATATNIVPIDKIRIVIGFKPNPYFLQKILERTSPPEK